MLYVLTVIIDNYFLFGIAFLFAYIFWRVLRRGLRAGVFRMNGPVPASREKTPSFFWTVAIIYMLLIAMTIAIPFVMSFGPGFLYPASSGSR